MVLSRTLATRWISDDLQLGLAEAGNLVQGDVQASTPAVDCAVGVETEISNVRRITVQLYNWQRVAIDKETAFEIVVYASPTMSALSSGGSTGLASTTNLCVAIIPKLFFLCATNASGFWEGTWTDTGTATFCIGIKLPNGRTFLSSQFANA